MLRVEVLGVRPLRFDDGTPVRAASAVARFGDGWLVVQDDATHVAWCTATAVTPLRVLPPVGRLDLFSAAKAEKRRKPDLEAACEVTVAGEVGVLLLGSGSRPARMRVVLVLPGGGGPRVAVADLSALYARVAGVLDIAPGGLNLEGACRIGDRLRWFHRGNRRVGGASASVDVDLAALLGAVTGATAAESVAVGSPRRYDLGVVDGVALTFTDTVALPGGRVLASAVAEDTPDAVDDGPVGAAVLVLLDGDAVVAVAPVPGPDGGPPWKVEGLAVRSVDADGVDLVAVADADDPAVPSPLLDLRVRWS